jgi:dipeptidyl-peptidase 4
MIIIATACLLACLLMPIAAIPQKNKLTIELEDIYLNNIFNPEIIRGMNPLMDGKTFAMITDTSINVYDYERGDLIRMLVHRNELIPEGKEQPIRLGSYSLNHDETMILIPTATERIYRHSARSYYFVYNLNDKTLLPLSENGKQGLASFSPDGKMIAFVRDNNIFVKHLTKGIEQQITFDGKENEIINGTTDWVYEEEFAFTKAFFWSPDSRRIAFYRFDESHVKVYQLALYGKLYPEWHEYRYPKAGEDNSKITIHVFDFNRDETVQLDLQADQHNYFPRLQWTQNPELLALQQLNRHQNHLEIFLANASTGSAKLLYEEKNTYYIDITDDLSFLPGNEHFIISSEQDGFNHIYLYNLDGKLLRQLTKGNWDVTAIYGFDKLNGRLYFQSAEKTPIERQIFSVDLKGNKKQISNRPGYNNASFSADFNYFVNVNTTANTPHYITVNRADGYQVRLIIDNRKLTEKLSAYNLAEVEFFEIADSSFILPDGQITSLNAYRLLPPDFNPNNQYPVFFYVYGGPGSQTVTNSWGWSNYLWFQHLAQKGIIVISIDNRGTGARGEQFKKMTYLQLGKYETDDIITAARYISQLGYVNPERIGIYGWSYGGYMSSLAILKGADVFSSAIAVAPVTNWRYYDNIYTERYMRTPTENPDGYDHNSPINHVQRLKGDFLLIHGSADDNVHYQNTMEMANALVKANKQFELMIYPDRNHGLHGGNARFHVFKLMTDFLERTLLTEHDPFGI